MLVNDAGRLPLPIIDNSAKMAIYAANLAQSNFIELAFYR